MNVTTATFVSGVFLLRCRNMTFSLRVRVFSLSYFLNCLYNCLSLYIWVYLGYIR